MEKFFSRRWDNKTAKRYHCRMCGRDVIALSMAEVLKKVQVHSKQKHNIDQYTSEQLQAVRRNIKSYM